jgi:HlyD family secretion protein
MKPPLRVRAIIVLVVVIAGLGAWLFHSGRLARSRAPSNELTLYGNVDVRQVELGFRVAGRLKTMALEEGQSVRAGMVLATLDERAFEDELHLAEADVAVQDATAKKLVAGNRPAEIARARAAVDEAMASQLNARASFEREQRLFESSAIPQSSLDDALAATRVADARLASATETHRLLVQGSRTEDIAAGKASLRAAQARLAAAQTALDDTQLVAPSDGVVISRVREPGAIVSPNDIVYVVSLTHSVWVRAYVAEPQLGKLRLGMYVAVLSDSAPNRRVRAHVGFISPTAEFTPKSVETPELRTDLVYRVRLIVDEPDEGLHQGMPVTVEIPAGGPGP